jgi:hyperosmotically inducible protein
MTLFHRVGGPGMSTGSKSAPLPDRTKEGLWPALVSICLVSSMSACQPAPPATFQRDIEDAVITSAVKSKILADPMALSDVNVETVRSRVYLSGVVPTTEQKQRAHELAIEVPGVVRVVNNLQVLEGRSL